LSLRGAARTLALWSFHIVVVRPLLGFFAGVRYRRRSNLPDGPCLLVANHNSHLDAPVLLSLFPLRRLPQVHPVAAADYFGETWVKRTIAMVLMNALPIQRNPGAGQDPLAGVVRALEQGRSIILFPEGTRGEAGVVAPFRSGVGRIVRAIPGLTVVPVFLQGPERIWPRGEVVPVPQGVDVHVGKPRSYDAGADAREIAEAVRQDVLALAPAVARPPGPRASAPVHVAICGGPPQTRRAAVEAAVVDLSSRYRRALGWTDRVLLAENGRPRDPRAKASRAKAWHGLAARIVGARAPHDGARFAQLVRRARIEQALCADPDAGVVVTDGSALVDLLASTLSSNGADDRELYQRLQHATAQRRIPFTSWWQAAREDPEGWLLNALSLARMHEPTVLVLEDDEPAHRRIADLLRRTRRTEVIDASRQPEAAGTLDPRVVEAIARRS
jgi:1-acyl-sn-glycerol-3-phosphate acyltransferase